MGLSKRKAKLIRIGIRGRCNPVLEIEEDDGMGGTTTHVLPDFERMWDWGVEYELYKNNSVVKRAYEQTNPWKSVRRLKEES